MMTIIASVIKAIIYIIGNLICFIIGLFEEKEKTYEVTYMINNKIYKNKIVAQNDKQVADIYKTAFDIRQL